MLGRRLADLLLFCVTATELVILFLLTPRFTIADWIYVLQHLMVLGIAITRPHPTVRDYSIASSTAVIIAYAYPYAQVICLRESPGYLASYFGEIVWGPSGCKRSGHQWTLQIRPPPNVSLVHSGRHRL